MTQHACALLGTSPSLILAYLIHRKDEKHCLFVWRELLSALVNHPAAIQRFEPLLIAIQQDSLPRYLKPKNGEVDESLETLLTMTLAGDGPDISAVRSVLTSPGERFFMVFSCFVVIDDVFGRIFSLGSRLFQLYIYHYKFLHSKR